MRVVFLCTVLSLLSVICFGQTKTVDLDGVTVLPANYTKHKKKVRTEDVHLVFPQHLDRTKKGSWDSTYFLTKFPRLEAYPIRIYSVDLKLAPFDTALMDAYFVLFQMNDKDTILTTYKIADPEKIKKNKLTLHFTPDDNMIVQPAEFYMGYNFRSKNNPPTFKYRLYSSSKGGEGLFVTYRNGEMDAVINPHFHYIFPFTLSYDK